MTNYQITLFFVDNTIYNIDKVAKELLGKNESLKEPILIPQQIKAPKAVNFPVIIFDKNNDFKIVANFYTMVITMIKKENVDLIDTMNKIYDVLEENEIKTYRIGYVYKSEIEEANIEKFKKQRILNDEIKNSKCFELSWLQDIKINQINVNCWQRYFTLENNMFLNTIFDINTKVKENNIVDRTFMQDFINDSESFVLKNIFK